MKKVCETCKWYETYTGACCNGDSDYCADYVSSMNSCENWDGGKMVKNVECPYCHVREDRQVVETGQVLEGLGLFRLGTAKLDFSSFFLNGLPGRFW